MVFKDSIASYSLQSAFAASGAEEQLLNCHNPAPDITNLTQICMYCLIVELFDRYATDNLGANVEYRLFEDNSQGRIYDIRQSDNDPALVLDVYSFSICFSDI